jgi:hypothetical protein
VQSWSEVGLPYFDPFPTGCHAPPAPPGPLVTAQQLNGTWTQHSPESPSIDIRIANSGAKLFPHDAGKWDAGTCAIRGDVLDCRYTGPNGFAAHQVGTAHADAGGKLTLAWQDGPDAQQHPLHWGVWTKPGSDRRTLLSRSVLDAGAKPQGVCMCAANQTGDDSIVANALRWLGTFEANGTQPFFLAVGLHRPHLPWSVPQEYFDLYDEGELALAVHEHTPKGMPPIAWHSCSREEDMGSCIPAATDEPTIPATAAEQRHTRHGYYAAVSYADDRVVHAQQAGQQQVCK